MIDVGWMGYIALMSAGDVRGVDVEHVSVSSGPSSVNIYNDEYTSPQRRLTLEERVNALERYMYDDERSGEPGLLKAEKQSRWLSQLNTYMLIGVILLLIVQMFYR